MGFFPLHFFMGILILISCLFYPSTVFAESLLDGDKRALLDFAAELSHSRRPLNWEERLPACESWTGISCDEEGKRVISVRLPGLGLGFHGPIPENTIGRLSALRVLSLRSNGIDGPLPADFGNLKNLTFLYLQHNNLSGPLLFDFSVFRNLSVIDLSDNRFTGSIPSSFSGLNRLVYLNLANNSFSGYVPNLSFPNLELLDLSNNDLVGSVPESLQRFPKASFSGNNYFLLNYTYYNPTAKNIGGKLKLNERVLLGIVIAGSVLGLLGFGLMLLVFLLRRKTNDNNFPGKLEKGNMSLCQLDASNKLTFFEGCSYAFDLEDLLRASAEVLGKGSFGTTYRATLEDASTVVVKRLKDVSVGKREFEQQMSLIGNIKHENVIEMRAYYYSKDEKLMVYDYHDQGSLSSILHGKRGENRAPLDWESRLNLAIGAAKGIARVHLENGGKLVHGNVKSSNVFLNSRGFGCVSDLGLSTVMGSLAPPMARSAGYRAPEVMDTRKALQPSDVYGFGVILLELLTGKTPVHTVNGDEIVHLVRWVHSVVREEWTAEVFDVELLRCPNIEEELVEVLQIALGCVVRMPDHRPKMSEVVRSMESVRRAVESKSGV